MNVMWKPSKNMRKMMGDVLVTLSYFLTIYINNRLYAIHLQTVISEAAVKHQHSCSVKF